MKLRRPMIYIWAFLCAISAPLSASDVHFGVPFDFPLYLSGNFGELRSNHFHGGLDFKTQGVVGKPLLAIADGYIAKVTVTPGGYGNALYICHDNGYTSVHGHLDHFIPAIAKRVHEKQYAEQAFAVTVDFAPEEFRVRQGDVVAYAGNTGYSFGPHLHMEIRHTATNEPVDPLQFYLDKIADNVAPRATRIMVYGAKGRGKVENTLRAQKGIVEQDGKITFSPQLSNHNFITAWGRIGTAISANDYMTGTHNVYGVRYVRLYVDDKLVSASDVDRFSFDENRMINSWTDYAERRRSGRWYMRSTIEENNALHMLTSDENRGWVTIDEERDYHFRYELEDLHGNRSTYRFVVKGKRMDIPVYMPAFYYAMDASRANRFYTDGFELWLPQGILFDDVELSFDIQDSESRTDYAPHYKLSDEAVPLLRAGEVTIPITLWNDSVDVSKLYVARVDDNRRIYQGGVYDYGCVKANITELGTYTVCADTVPPKITPIGSTSWRKQGRVVFRIVDAHTGIRDYNGYIDGRWVLFKYSSKNARMWCDLKAEGIGSSHHEVKVVVTDVRGNRSVVSYDF